MICFHFCIFVVLATTVSARRQRGNALWFAFIFVSLSYWQQLRRAACSTRCCCDLLSFLYLCRTGNNRRCLRTATRRLWFAFIFVSLSYWQQHHVHADQHQHRCDLLSFLYLCRTGNNIKFTLINISIVVICFHFCIFVVLATTSSTVGIYSNKLWFAFIFVSLSYWQQRTMSTKRYLDVVICFHFCIFVVLATTYGSKQFEQHLLWFAFIFVSLSYWQQPTRRRCSCPPVVICFHFCIFVVLATTEGWNCRRRVELWFAFIFVSFSYWQQPLVGDWARLPVVICFHFCIFVVLATTSARPGSSPPWLWFAFIFVSLSYWQQQNGVDAFIPDGCDLLSFLYLCRTGNNKKKYADKQFAVVICFHFCIFVVLATTEITVVSVSRGCDLLSFLYLCRTGNNIRTVPNSSLFVVICFHFCIFVVLATTAAVEPLCQRALWFAFIFVSLSYWQQLKN